MPEEMNITANNEESESMDCVIHFIRQGLSFES